MQRRKENIFRDEGISDKTVVIREITNNLIDFESYRGTLMIYGPRVVCTEEMQK